MRELRDASGLSFFAESQPILQYECPHCNASVSEVLTCPNCHRELGLECCMPAGTSCMCLACEEELLADDELKDEEW